MRFLLALFLFISASVAQGSCEEAIEQLISDYLRRVEKGHEAEIEISPFARVQEFKWDELGINGKPIVVKGRNHRLYTTGQGRVVHIDEPAGFEFNHPDDIFSYQKADLEEHSKYLTTAIEYNVDYQDPRMHAAIGITEDVRKHTVKLGEGGMNHVYLFHKTPLSPGIVEGSEAHKLWAIQNVPDLQVVRFVKGTFWGKALAQREFILRQLVEETSASATMKGKKFIRAAKNFSTPEDLNLGITKAEFIQGPTADQIQNALDAVKSASTPAQIKEDALSFLNKNGISDIDEMQLQVRGLESYYKRIDAMAMQLHKENKIPHLGNSVQNLDYHGALEKNGISAQQVKKSLANFPFKDNSGKIHDDLVENVGVDFNHGQNVMWSVKEKMWVIIDY